MFLCEWSGSAERRLWPGTGLRLLLRPALSSFHGHSGAFVRPGPGSSTGPAESCIPITSTNSQRAKKGTKEVFAHFLTLWSRRPCYSQPQVAEAPALLLLHAADILVIIHLSRISSALSAPSRSHFSWIENISDILTSCYFISLQWWFFSPASSLALERALEEMSTVRKEFEELQLIPPESSPVFC